MVDIGIPPEVGDLFGVGGTQGWEDRLREAAYTSPGGTRITFEYEDVQRVNKKRGTVFEFPGINDVYVQQKGFSGRQYPLRCFFSGANHDRVATAFELAVLEPGIGKLEHPLYGTIPNVVPFGQIGRRDDLRTQANQTVVELTFWTTLRQIYPSGSKNPENEISAALGLFDVEAAQEFAANMDLSDTIKKANATATIQGFLRSVSAALTSVADATASVRRDFDNQFRLINFGIDVLIGQPLLLAQQISNLIRTPARALAGIQSRLDGYLNLAESIFGSEAGRPQDKPFTVSVSELTKRANDARIADLFAMNSPAGSVLSTVLNEFATKPDAIGAAAEVTDQFDAVVAWRDDLFAEIGAVDTGASYQALQEAVALTAGFLVEVSFSLVAERQITLDRPRTIVDLAAQLYGSVDPRLDLLISSNNLTGSEILEVPRGRLIRYYP